MAAIWTSDELDKIGNADELEMVSLRQDGTLRRPVTIGLFGRATISTSDLDTGTMLRGFVAPGLAAKAALKLAASRNFYMCMTFVSYSNKYPTI